MHKILKIHWIVAVAALASSACVTQQKYDDTQLAAKHYQKQAIDKDALVESLQRENDRLKRMVDASEANFRAADSEYADRLQSLQNVIAELGANPGDVTKFRVDGGFVYRVKESILFPLGSAEVGDEGRKIVLEQIAPDINSRPHGKIFVRGHTDNIPVKKQETLAKFPHGNLQLSAARAIEVAALLAERGGVSLDRLVVMGFGPSDPIAPNSSDTNRQKNRRVEIFVADADGEAPAAPAEQLTDDTK